MLSNFKTCSSINASIGSMESLLLRMESTKERSTPDKKSRMRRYTIGAWLVTLFDVGLSGLGGYTIASSLLSLLFLPNPLVLAISILTSVFPAIIMAGLDAGDSKKVLGINIFKVNEDEKRLRQRINITEKLYNEINYRLSTRNLSPKNVGFLRKMVRRNNALIRHEYKKLYLEKPESKLHKADQWGLMAVNGLLHFGGGFMMGKCLLGLIGLALLPPPVSIALAVVGGIFALTTFMVLKRHTVFGIFDSILGKPKPLPEKMTDYIFAPDGIKQMEVTLHNVNRNERKQSYRLIKNKLIPIKNSNAKIQAQPTKKRKLSDYLGNKHHFNLFGKKSINDVRCNERPFEHEENCDSPKNQKMRRMI